MSELLLGDYAVRLKESGKPYTTELGVIGQTRLLSFLPGRIMETLQEFGLSLIRALQSWSPTLDGLMNLFTFPGKIEFYLLIIPFIFWAIDRRLGFGCSSS